MATIKDVARRAGVSAGTVSNVLNRPSYVSTKTRQRVLDAIEELDFVPMQEARQFRPGRERTLGFSIANMGNPFFVDVALGAEATAKELGVGIVFCNSGYDPVREEQNLDLLVQQRVQGIAITPVDENNPRLETLLDRGVPMVFVDRISGDRNCCSVVGDDYLGGSLAGGHLIDRGHERIAFIGHPQSSGKVRTRLEGLQGAMDARPDANVAISVLTTESWTVPAGRAAGEELLRAATDARPTAVVCANDMLALGLLQVLIHNGVRVPEEMSIVGYDDLEWAAVSAVPLTTVRQPRDELGRMAVELLMLEISENSRHVHQHLVLQPELVVRETT